MTLKPGPFGLKFGQPAEDFILTPWPEGYAHYRISSVPKPHPLFTSYYGRFVDQFGLTRVFADSDEITSDSEGYILRSRFNDFVDRLKVKYGEPEILDFKSRLSFDDDYNVLAESESEWMEDLSNNERHLCASWKIPPGKSHDRPVEMALLVYAHEPSEGYLRIEYTVADDKAALKQYSARLKLQNDDEDSVL